MTALPPPSSTGARIAGDRYQWLIVWQECVQALRAQRQRDPNPVVSIGVEVDDAGNLDDVVLYRRQPPHTYGQVKYAVDAASPVNEDYLLSPSRTGGPSVLRKMITSWQTLNAQGPTSTMRLITNRSIDPADPMLASRDSRTGLLLPRAGAGGSQSTLGKARQRWAERAGVSEGSLMAILAVLRFETSRDTDYVHELVALQMLAAGLREDDNAVHAGADWVARQVIAGHRHLTIEEIQIAAGEFEPGRSAPPRAVVSIATLAPDPFVIESDHAIDWVERFEGVNAFAKRRPAAPATWTQLQADIEAIPAHLPARTTAAAITGSLRQATAFTVGAALRDVTGVTDLAWRQRGQVWSTGQSYPGPLAPISDEHHLGQGSELAILIAITLVPTEDVLDYLRAHSLPVETLVVLQPPAGAGDTSIPDASTAIALAVGARDAARHVSRGRQRLHLFLAGPLGFSLLLGHRWNRVAPTVVYEDVHTSGTYELAFTVDA